MFSCQKKIEAVAACTSQVDSEVRLKLGYLGNCFATVEGSTQNMKVEITVDGLKIDGPNGPEIEFMESYNFNITNMNDGGTFPENVFPIKLPSCGSYLVSVIVRGKDESCFKCCNGSSSFDPNCGTSNSGKGTPRFRGTSLMINADAVTPPPTVVEIDPKKQGCTDCGC